MAQRICMLLFVAAIANGCATKSPSPQLQAGPQKFDRRMELAPPDTKPKAPREFAPGDLPVEPLKTAARFNTNS